MEIKIHLDTYEKSSTKMYESSGLHVLLTTTGAQLGPGSFDEVSYDLNQLESYRDIGYFQISSERES